MGRPGSSGVKLVGEYTLSASDTGVAFPFTEFERGDGLGIFVGRAGGLGSTWLCCVDGEVTDGDARRRPGIVKAGGPSGILALVSWSCC